MKWIVSETLCIKKLKPMWPRNNYEFFLVLIGLCVDQAKAYIVWHICDVIPFLRLPINYAKCWGVYSPECTEAPDLIAIQAAVMGDWEGSWTKVENGTGDLSHFGTSYF